MSKSAVSSPKVSVLIPAYNAAPTLARAIQSAIDQTERDLEIIVIDDGSADNTAEVADEYARRDARVSVVHMAKNGGKSRALNHVHEIARGRWFAVLDADDWYHPDRLARVIALGERTSADMATDNQCLVDSANGAILGPAFAPSNEARAFTPSDLIADHAGTNFDRALLKPVLRADFVRRHRLRYPEEASLGQDYGLLVEFFAAGGKAWLLPEPLYYYVLPWSPSTGTWTQSGNGAWRYDYRIIRRLNQHCTERVRDCADRDLVRAVRWRERHFAVMEHYMAAVRAFKIDRRPDRAAFILLSHPRSAMAFMARLARRLGGARQAWGQGGYRAHATINRQ